MALSRVFEPNVLRSGRTSSYLFPILRQNSNNNIFERSLCSMFVCFESMGIGEFLGEDSNRLFNSRRKAIDRGIMREKPCLRNFFRVCGNLFDVVRSWKRDKGKKGERKRERKRKIKENGVRKELGKIFFFFLLCMYRLSCRYPTVIDLSILRYYVA